MERKTSKQNVKQSFYFLKNVNSLDFFDLKNVRKNFQKYLSD